MKSRILSLVIGLGVVGTAGADNLFGEFKRVPDTIERGFYMGADFGIFTLTGDTKATNPGFQLAFTTGVDIIKYLSIEGIATMGINEAPANDFVLGGGVNTFLFNLAAKIQYPLDRWNPFVEIGPGIIYSKPELDPGQNKKMSFLIAAGIEYYTFLRHYSLYARGTYHAVSLPIDALAFSGGIKYTF